MRSAQTPFDIRAIMKKFIYMCNEKHYVISCLYEFSIAMIYEQIMNKM